MSHDTYFINGWSYTRQQVGDVVLINGVNCSTGETKLEVYRTQRNGLEVFQGYGSLTLLQAKQRIV
jgi:hypothetical protein